jgi:hypothetical protein
MMRRRKQATTACNGERIACELIACRCAAMNVALCATVDGARRLRHDARTARVQAAAKDERQRI